LPATTRVRAGGSAFPITRGIGLAPFVHLRDVIARLPRGEHPASLLPALWKAEQLACGAPVS